MPTAKETTAARPVAHVLELANESEEAGRLRDASSLRGLLVRNMGRRVLRPALEGIFQQPRVLKYRVLSTCRRIDGTPVILQPVLFVGPGEVVLGERVQFGWRASPQFYSGYCHVEVSRPHATVEVGDRTEFNNNLMIKSEGAGIRIGRDCLFGAGVEIFDSDFHDLRPGHRRNGQPKMAPVDIGDNVFAGMGVRILKGATIGSDAVIGAGAVVAKPIPPGTIAAGNPARVIREL
jgi:maltose O-acetyltransferase